MLLFDQNLSPHLVVALSNYYPGSRHVRDVGLEAKSDGEVWIYARQQGLAIVTKDSDFRQRSFLFGSPPKVIWIGLGNCSTQTIEGLLQSRRLEIEAFLSDADKAFLAFRS